jgi:uncharacterized protein (TIGR04255 family)
LSYWYSREHFHDDAAGVEVVLSVMLEPLIGFKAAHVGLLWNQVRKRFPKTVDQPPLDAPQENEEEPRRQLGPTIQFEPFRTPPLRTWFLNDQETELLQIQNDRVSRNWRRANTSEPYPSYDNIKGPFQKDLELVRTFLETNQVGDLKPKQCEVTYVNHIVAGQGWKTHGDVSRVIVNWKQPDDVFLPGIEDATLSWRYVIRDRKNFVGRLHVSLQPAYRSQDGTDSEIFVLTLTARGKPLGKGLEGALAFLDLGHEWIVRGFKDLTTPEMHQVWQLQV